MAGEASESGAREAVDAVYRSESRRIFATLVRLLGDFDLAEEALQEAFAAALTTWSAEGVPANPPAWLVGAGRHKGIDLLRRRVRFQEAASEVAAAMSAGPGDADPAPDSAVEDDRLRLIFTCCHPDLPPEARVALTLREVCDLTTEEIARAFLTTPPTIAQRIVRAKAKIREDRIPFRVPAPADLAGRLETVLSVIYLVFSESYSASAGNSLLRADLSGEAIRLGRLLSELLAEPEVLGLLALMVIQESRRAARTTPEGDLVLLEDQDRSRWDRTLIEEGLDLVRRALASGRAGPYSLQAAIASVHAEAPRAADTDWARIAALYDLLGRLDPSPIVGLNRAVAVAMRDGPEAGLALVEAILEKGELADYHFAHAARAELCRRLGRTADARSAYARALELARQEPERRFLQKRLHSLPTN